MSTNTAEKPTPKKATPAATANTPADEIKRLFELQTKNRWNIRHTTTGQRIKKLNKLRDKIVEYQPRLYEALRKDYRKAPSEADITEIYPTLAEISDAVKNLPKWSRNKSVSSPITLAGAKSELRYEPRGVTLIIGPWNYPFYLMICPLVSAIAAGNTAILKPSEFTTHTSALIKEMLDETFPENEVATVEGDAAVSAELLKLPFDHIFFTGSPKVGKIVMEAAAKHLTSVTLELGGKSPAIIEDSADLNDAARKIAWGKFINVGQTCVAPDYVLVPRDKQNAFLGYLKATLKDFYGQNPETWSTNPDFGRIINGAHFNRLKELFQSAMADGASVEIGGTFIDDENYVAPTVLSNVNLKSKIMQDEIFGPLLPIIAYDSLDEVLSLVNSKEKPLALYIFSKSHQKTEQLLDGTTSGGTCVNDTIVHLSNPHLPFGGVNNSGIGSYHGEFGFKAFSHERAVLKQNPIYTAVQLMYPPYTQRVKSLIKATIRFFT